MKKKLRLLITTHCHKRCEGCCNKDWDLKNLPICTDFSGYDEILITGGEPFLYRVHLLIILAQIRKANPTCKLYIYTAFDDDLTIEKLLSKDIIDGITFTLHDSEDIRVLQMLDSTLEGMKNKSLRLNIFKGIEVPELKSSWIIKDNIEWIKDCPLPVGEVFMRIDNP